jgi:hypothetical protein
MAGLRMPPPVHVLYIIPLNIMEKYLRFKCRGQQAEIQVANGGGEYQAATSAMAQQKPSTALTGLQWIMTVAQISTVGLNIRGSEKQACWYKIPATEMHHFQKLRG